MHTSPKLRLEEPSTFRTMPTPTVSTNQTNFYIDDSRSHHVSGLPPMLYAYTPSHRVMFVQVRRNASLKEKSSTLSTARTSVSRFPLTKQEILSQYSGCFEGIGHFPGDLYKFHLKPDLQACTTCTKEGPSPS